MRALVKYEKGAKKLRIESREIPRPKRGEVLVKVLAAGVCATDIHVYLADSRATNPPVIMGHEMVGIVDSLGPEVENVEVGAVVTAEPCVYTCGNCSYCVTGRENLCAERIAFGSGVDGAFAEYLVLPARNVHAIPQGLNPRIGVLSEPLACCVLAVFEHNGVRPGDEVLLTGPGAIGLLCLAVLKHVGARVVVLGTAKDRDRLRVAEELGADRAVSLDERDSADLSVHFSKQRADAVFECSGAQAAIDMGLSMIKRGGTLTQVGLAGNSIRVPMDYVTFNEIQISGTFAQKKSVWERTMAILSEKGPSLERIITDTIPLENWREVFDHFDSRPGIKHILDPTG